MFGKWIQRGVLAATAAAFTVIFGQGCTVDQESQLFIRQVLTPVAPQCQVTADATSPAQGSGVLDMALSQEYKAWLLIGNQLVPRGSQDQVRTETSRVSLKSAEVRISSASDGKELNAYTYPLSGFVDESSGTEPGFGLTLLPIIDRGSLVALTANGPLARGDQRRLVARVKVEGRTLGGSDVKSNEFQFVVQVCRGCTIDFSNAVSAETDSNGKQTTSPNNCFGAAATGAGVSNVVPCFFGQDSSTPCASCKGSVAECGYREDQQ